MDNNYSLVINNTTQEITIKEWKKRYSKELKKTVECCTDEGEILGPGEHACFRPAELKKAWKSRLISSLMSSEKRVSLKGKRSKEGVVLSVGEFEYSVGIVFNMVGNGQLVKESVSREEVKKLEGTKSSGKHEERIAELKKHLISIVVERNTASTSLPLLGEEEKLDQVHVDDVDCASSIHKNLGDIEIPYLNVYGDRICARVSINHRIIIYETDVSMVYEIDVWMGLSLFGLDFSWGNRPGVPFLIIWCISHTTTSRCGVDYTWKVVVVRCQAAMMIVVLPLVGSSGELTEGLGDVGCQLVELQGHFGYKRFLIAYRDLFGDLLILSLEFRSDPFLQDRDDDLERFLKGIVVPHFSAGALHFVKLPDFGGGNRGSGGGRFGDGNSSGVDGGVGEDIGSGVLVGGATNNIGRFRTLEAVQVIEGIRRQ
ncbi:hypothetical protein ACH5RR_016082 [Cinchona calisaya]|uniref:Uncharacterized protein n=1 Tax=Cinchona calisaya TaxID=153742 RepID=A0ABD3A0G2_9GENT